MSQHLDEEALWEAAKSPPVGDDYAHLQLCQECREQLEGIKFAQSMLVEPPPPPLLSEQSARRIGTVLRKAAETEARRAQWWGSWWPFNWNPTWALAPLAAVLLAFAAYRMNAVLPSDESGGSAPLAKKDDVAPTPPPMPEAPRPLPVKKVVASVKRTKAAKSGAVALKKSQKLEEGSTVATAKGGELLMALPDGSQIGLASASQVQLAKLEDKAVTLDLAKGSMKVTANHDPTRELRVRAGDLEVYDVGTEFIVTRDEGRTLVAVEEGEVEVKTASGESVPLKAGQAVEYKGGKLERQQWATAEELPKPRPTSLAARPKQTPSPVAHQAGAEETPEIPSEPQKATPPPAPVQDPEQPTAKAPEVATNEPAAAHDEWATPENLKDAPVHTPPPTPPAEPPPPAVQAPTAMPQPTPPPPEQQAPAPPTEDEANVSFLAKLQKQAMKVKDAFTPRPRLARASDIATLTDQKKCGEALALADAWLTEPVPKGESFNLRRSVLQSKLRCLNFLGRSGDATAVQRELDRL